MGDTINGKGYELRGEVVRVGEVETVGAKGFKKRVVVLKTADAKYPQLVPVEFTQGCADLPDGYEPGQVVVVTFDLQGREYNGRYYGSLRGWRISAANDADAEVTPSPAPAASGEARPADDAPF